MITVIIVDMVVKIIVECMKGSGEYMNENRLEIRGIPIILNTDLNPFQIKEKGFINGIGKEIVTEVEVGEEVYHQLKVKYRCDVE